MAEPGAQTISLAARRYTLGVLVAVYTFNFIDRQIIGILAVPIKADLSLTDTQLGLMGGLAFALFYTALGIPIAMQHIKLLPLALLPFGRVVRDMETGREYP